MNWRNWLPSAQQMSNAAQLRSKAYGNGTMQQAMGMIVVLSLLAGLLPLIVHWVLAARIGTVLPLAQAAQSTADAQNVLAGIGGGIPWLMDPTALSDLYQTLAGLEQPLPGWLAAGLSALGEWLNWPLRWLAVWLVYGVFVMTANKAMGGHVTLQRFYAATGYAATPLLLTGLSPIPCLGALAVLVGGIWSLAVYIHANAEVTGLAVPRAVVAVLLPIPVLGFLLLLAAGFVFAIAALLAL
jgi:hypothetical protein